MATKKPANTTTATKKTGGNGYRNNQGSIIELAPGCVNE